MVSEEEDDTVVSSLSLVLFPGFHPILCPFPEELNLKDLKNFIWGWSGSMNGYCAVSIVLLQSAVQRFIVEMPPEREAEES